VRKDIEQMHVALGSIGFHTNHPDLYVLGLLNVILGGNMSSRLFNEVREKEAWRTPFQAGQSLDDTGLVMIRAGVDNTKIVNVEVISERIGKNL
jgi:predicted Zn-dependent peptidase